MGHCRPLLSLLSPDSGLITPSSQELIMSQLPLSPIRSVLCLFLIVIVVLFPWFSIQYLLSEPHAIPSIKSVVVPFLWCCLFMYAVNKGYFYATMSAYVIFLLMLYADIINFGEVLVAVQLSYLLLSVSLLFLLIFTTQFILSFFSKTYLFMGFSFFVVLCVLPLFYIIYSISFNVAITEDIIYAIMQTNSDESLEFLIDYISPLWIFGVLGLFFVHYVFLKKQKSATVFSVEFSLQLFLGITFLSLLYVNKDNLRLYAFTTNTVKSYWYELAEFTKIQERLKADDIVFQANKQSDGETYVVVIGESLNKDHMGIYDYHRQTTPMLSSLLANDELLLFDNAYSSHTHTMPVLSLSLTEANQQNKKNYYDSLSIINILNKADVDTYWITNQVLRGSWDNLISVLAHQADHLIPLNNAIGNTTKTQSFDGAVIEELNAVLNRPVEKNRVIFVHLMGSHSSYCSRYPSEYEKYSGVLKASEFGLLNLDESLYQSINCYDNTVLYGDYVVGSIIDLLEKNDGVNGLLYFSDHADDVISKVGHNATNFTYDMTRIPLFFWLSEKYKNTYQEKIRSLVKNQNSLFSNDDIYDTLVGFFDVETERYQAVNDLTSEQYFLDEESAYTLHGKVAYSASENAFFHQSKNAEKILDNKQGVRILPHRVNSTGKLRDVLSDDFVGIELDVIYGLNNKDVFTVSHDESDASDLTFEDFLSIASVSSLEKIWLDLKNINEENYRPILLRLNQLNEKFSLQDSLILETAETADFISDFTRSGWHTSYYLPTRKILNMLVGSDIEGMESLAEQIAIQAESQSLSAVSFDQSLYPFVKTYLESLLPDTVVYHTWDLTIKLYDKDIDEKLEGQLYYQDNRVKTILLPYKSHFSL
jgi:glucan phosphoethanolaminetransferase (alkaline phosphatase superfamily)